MSGLKIGVVVPAYNVERYVETCLNSLLAQTYADFEVYVMDDGSRDRTPEILESFAARDGRIRVWHQENRGLVPTMNALMDRLDPSVDALAFVDADDFIHPRMLEILARALDCHRADVVECGILPVPAEASPKTVKWTENPEPNEHIVDEMSVYWLHRTAPPGWVNKWNKLYRRASIEGIRFQPTLSYEDDYFFACEVNARIRRKVLTDAVLYAYRDNPGSVTSRIPFRRYVEATCERIRLTEAVFIRPGRVPAELLDEYRRDLAKDAYRMCVRKNLKKNANPSERRELFLLAGERLSALERDYGFSPVGLNPVQRLAYGCCTRGFYRLARLLAFLT